MNRFKPAAIVCALMMGKILFASDPDAPTPKLVEVPYGQTTTIHSPAPRYPAKERAAHASGVVTVLATVAADGSVTAVKVTSCQMATSFGVAASEAVSQWKFDPRAKNGQRAPFVVSIELYFMNGD